MSLAIQLRQRFATTSIDVFRAQPGILAPTNGNYLFGYCENFDAQVTHWFRSTNNGTSWSQVSDAPGGNHNHAVFGTHATGNAIIFPAANASFTDAQIMRTLDAGSSWSQVESYNGPTSAPFRTVIGAAAATLNRSSIIIVGQFGPSASGPWVHSITSADAGAHWSDGPQIWDANNGSWGTAICNVGNGRLIAAGTMATTRSYYGKLQISEDSGATWHDSAALPLPTNARTIDIRAITAVTDQIILAGGLGNTSPLNDAPFLWRSTDSGETWTLLTSANIANWPGADVSTDIWEIKRLTRDLVALGLAQAQDNTDAPWRFSNDGGANFDLVPTIESGSMPPTSEGMGEIVATRNGKLLLPLYARQDGYANREVWEGTIVC